MAKAPEVLTERLTVKKYIDWGFDVGVEASAGEGIQISNDELPEIDN